MNKSWNWIGIQILKFKIAILAILCITTICLVYIASQIQLSYELAKILPKTDDQFQLYESFKKKYGEDGNVMVIGLENPNLFKTTEFDAWNQLFNEIKKESGIKSILALPNLPEVYIDEQSKSFKTRPLFYGTKSTQIQLDSLKSKLGRLPIYRNFLFTEDLRIHLMLITLDQKTINNKNRITLVKRIKALGENYSTNTHNRLHYSGMPFIRTEYTSQVTNELVLFLLLAIAVTSLILY